VRVHFKDCDTPDLKEGSELTANCGAVVRNAVFAMKFDFDLGEISEWNSLRICRECRDLEFDHRFVYGICNGQESKQ